MLKGKYKRMVDCLGENKQPDSKQPTEITINKTFDLKSALIGKYNPSYLIARNFPHTVLKGRVPLQHKFEFKKNPGG